jgi:hypothetical protein
MSGRGNIFVSYSRHDLEWVRQLVTDLEAAGLPAWLDVHNLEPGVVWDTEIERALHGTNILLAILSEHSAESRNVLDEINFALSRNRLVVPVLYRNCQIPYRLARLQHVDFTGKYDPALKKLVEQLRVARGRTDPSPGVAAPIRTASTVPAVIPVWRRPAVVAGIVSGSVLLLVGVWLFRGDRDAVPAAVSTVLPAVALQQSPPVAANPAIAQEPPRSSVDVVRETPSPSNDVRTPRALPPAAVPPRTSIGRAADTTPAAAPAHPAPAPAASAPEKEVRPADTPPVASAHPPSITSNAAAEEPAPPAPRVPSATVGRNEEELIRKVVALYARAINEKSVSLLLQARPSMSRSEAQALIRSMPATHTVSFRDVAVTIDGTNASVRLTRHDVVRDNTGTSLQTALNLALSRRGESWVIERIQRAE